MENNYLKRHKRQQKEVFMNVLLWFTLICSTIILAATCKNEYDKQIVFSNYSQHYIDSLNNRIYQLEIRLKRYNFILDIIDEMPDEKCKNKIDSIFKNTQ